MLVSNNKVLKINNKWLNGHGSSPVPPGPSLPPYTLRLKYKQGTTPTFSKGTGELVDAANNIWDLTYENTDWSTLLSYHSDLLEVIDGNTSGVTNMDSIFYSCISLTSVSLFDTSNVTNMRYAFNNCKFLTSVPLFNTSNVTNMAYMFSNCTSLTAVPLFDTSNVTNMSSTFNNCGSLTTVPLFNTSKVTDMYAMFYDCITLTSVPLFNTSNVTIMNSTFNSCESLTSVPLFNTSKVTNMANMLNSCTQVQTGALALYQQASTQTNPPSNHYNTFMSCGSNTQTGAAELAQIPSDWGGTGA